MSLFPLARFDVIDESEAANACVSWGHYLGSCDRPFGMQWFGLFVSDDLVSVAISASSVSSTVGEWNRTDVVELARLVTRPDAKWATRVALRLWRELAPQQWSIYWPVRACVSYQDAVRHTGNIYRLDGWRRVAEKPGSSGGGTWASRKPRVPKVLWDYELRSVS